MEVSDYLVKLVKDNGLAFIQDEAFNSRASSKYI